MSGSQMTGVAWRTDGFWTLAWLRIWFHLTSGRRMSFPPKGFVGKVSLSSVATGNLISKLSSTRMRREASTRSAPLWRLTCEWRINLPRPRKSKRGFGLGNVGNSWGTDGEGGSAHPTSTTSI